MPQGNDSNKPIQDPGTGTGKGSGTGKETGTGGAGSGTGKGKGKDTGPGTPITPKDGDRPPQIRNAPAGAAISGSVYLNPSG